MKLEFTKIKEISQGAVRVTQEGDGFHFYRFTESQEELYKHRSDDFYQKCRSTSGVRLSFKTNSKTLYLNASVSYGSGRQYIALDLFVNGTKVDALKNFDESILPQGYAFISYPESKFEKCFTLGEGIKDVCLYLPWSAKTVIQELSLDDGAFVEPIRSQCKLLCFGDSITQGYDALFPSDKYTTRLARWLDAEEYNKGIGGEVFFSELAGEKEEFVPDYITVAYGTNDRGRKMEDFMHACESFFQNLHANYPETKTIVITPIWCKDAEGAEVKQKLDKIAEFIGKQVENYENMILVPGFELVEHKETLFGDLSLHPNDKGFECYFENLSKCINKMLQN